jgi:hypothetical protein
MLASGGGGQVTAEVEARLAVITEAARERGHPILAPLALALAAYARSPVTVITTASHIIDLGGVDGTGATAVQAGSAPAAGALAQAGTGGGIR